MKFARIVFMISGMYGIVVILPLFFTEQTLAAQYPPAITHPEYFYSFAGVTLAWQILFIVIAVTPERLRSVMPVCILEKLSLVPTFFILGPQGRFPQLWIPLLIVDLILGSLFLVAFLKSRPEKLSVTAGTC